MTMPSNATSAQAMHDRALVLAVLALGVVLFSHLTLALLAGMLLYTLGVELRECFEQRIGLRHPALWSVAALCVLLVAAIAALLRFIPDAIASGADYPAIAQEIATALDKLRTTVPGWLSGHVPESLETIRASFAGWLREHPEKVELWGKETLRGVAHLIVGAIIGTLAVVQTGGRPAYAAARTPWLAALGERFSLFATSFKTVVYAQIRIAALNTLLTGIYVLVVLPAMGTPLPLAWTLVGFTFATSLIPIVGNLVSNTLLVLMSLTHGITVAVMSLVFLISIHKLEYFLNAHIIGARVHTKTYEMLTCMVVFEVAFGVPGLVIAPVVYAYAKAELTNVGWL